MIHGMLLCRNESSRSLEKEYNIFSKVLKNFNLLCDTVTVIDDNSDDDTFERVMDYIKEVVYKTQMRVWDKDELYIRKELWNKTIEKANHGDWIICLDADELIDNPEGVRFMLNNLTPNIDGLGFRLFDMWSMTHYRDDQHWKAHNYPWPMAVRYDANKDYIRHEKALHCGRFPANASHSMLPTMIPIRHYGWALEEDRKIKHDRYMRIDGEGKHGILAQYESILDPNPTLRRFGE
jgi:glycosyltransferase involved in cell wall biosynthesis